MTSDLLLCDGCSQPASHEHLARRLHRLEWATRFRPLRIATLLLGTVSPALDDDFLYSGKFGGEARALLDAAGIAVENKSPETALSEFQRGGFFLSYLLECPLDASGDKSFALDALVSQRLAAVAARIRRSLKPKRTVLFASADAPGIAMIADRDLGCPVVLDRGKPFVLGSGSQTGASTGLRELLVGTAAGQSHSGM